MVTKLRTLTDPEKVRYSWTNLAVFQQKAHWQTALTAAGTHTTVITLRMCQSNVPIRTQSVSVFVQVTQLRCPATA